MSEELKSALARIACLEGGIANRDARIVELQRAEKNDAIAYKAALERQDELRAELSAIKAQEPVVDEQAAFEDWITRVCPGGDCSSVVDQWLASSDYADLYAAPVSEAKAQDFDPLVCDYCNAETQDPWHGSGMLNGVESRHIHACSQCRNLLPTAKAQGVVQWPEADEIMQMAFEEGQPADDASGYCFELEEFDLFIERLMSEVARLNTAPAQQVSVPDVSAMARILADRNADACNANREDNWAIYGRDYIDDVAAMLAAPAAPAADAGLVEALEKLARLGNGDKYGNSDGNFIAQAALAAHSAKGVV